LKIVKRFIEIGGKIQLYFGTFCLIAIIVSVSAGVLFRKVFNSPLSWIEEICTFLFIWLAFAGASVAAMNKKHVSADFLTTKLSEKKNKILAIIQRILIILLLGVIFIGSCMLQSSMSGHSSTNLDIPKNFYYLPILISSFYMIVVYIVELIELTVNPNRLS